MHIDFFKSGYEYTSQIDKYSNSISVRWLQNGPRQQTGRLARKHCCAETDITDAPYDCHTVALLSNAPSHRLTFLQSY